ncbi:hypothetical protein [Rhizobium sp. SL42]|uniref:hypothetical protein n=1 Tax=Rhizobium sp. SL42 TaxID=2806346 RepID=UPI001F1D3804|nr:hypothetical protein [Rhizobium sp. SL42]UJW74195.1 hypothetical protein IM739_15105 [Rhizobium sp. SL42]
MENNLYVEKEKWRTRQDEAGNPHIRPQRAASLIDEVAVQACARTVAASVFTLDESYPCLLKCLPNVTNSARL